LVPVGAQVLPHDAAEVQLGRPVRRAVVVREVEVGHAEVERTAEDRPLGLYRALIAEVLPEPEGDLGQLHAASPAPAGTPVALPVTGRNVGHAGSLSPARQRRPGGWGGGAAGGEGAAPAGPGAPPAGS